MIYRPAGGEREVGGGGGREVGGGGEREVGVGEKGKEMERGTEQTDTLIEGDKAKKN